jgi:HEAT repeat protein
MEIRVSLIIAVICQLSCCVLVRAADESKSNEINERSAVADLIGQLHSNDKSNRIAAARALVKIGPSTSEQVGNAVWGNFMDTNATLALEAFVEVGPEAVPMMLELMRQEKTGLLHDNPGIGGLIQMGTNAMPGLVKTLQDPNPEVRGVTIDALRILAGAQEICIPSAHLLIHAAKTERDDSLRVYAIDALGYFGLITEPPDIVCEALRELLHDKLEKARLTAAYSLAKACRDSASDALPIIAKGVSSDDKELAWESAFALNFLGTNALPELPEITRAIDNSDRRTADELFRFLGNIGDPAFFTLQKAATNVARNDLRIIAINSFGDFAASTKTNLPQAVAILSEALKDSDRDIRQAAVNSLRRAAVERKEPKLCSLIAGKIRPLLADKDEWIRDDVKRSLDEIESVVTSSKP